MYAMRWLTLLALLLAPARLVPAQVAFTGTVVRGDGPVRDAVVFLVSARGDGRIPPPETAIVDQRGLRFVPEVLAVSPGSEVEFPNSDPVMHNVFHPGDDSSAFDLGTYARSERRTFRFTAPGLYVMLCHVHPEMFAFVAVVPSALRAVTDSVGAFRLEGVPPGAYRLHVWRNRAEDPDLPITIGVSEHTTIRIVLRPRSRRGSTP